MAETHAPDNICEMSSVQHLQSALLPRRYCALAKGLLDGRAAELVHEVWHVGTCRSADPYKLEPWHENIHDLLKP